MPLKIESRVALFSCLYVINHQFTTRVDLCDRLIYVEVVMLFGLLQSVYHSWPHRAPLCPSSCLPSSPPNLHRLGIQIRLIIQNRKKKQSTRKFTSNLYLFHTYTWCRIYRILTYLSEYTVIVQCIYIFKLQHTLF